jgi:hypothetical protein
MHNNQSLWNYAATILFYQLVGTLLQKLTGFALL